MTETSEVRLEDQNETKANDENFYMANIKVFDQRIRSDYYL